MLCKLPREEAIKHSYPTEMPMNYDDYLHSETLTKDLGFQTAVAASLCRTKQPPEEPKIPRKALRGDKSTECSIFPEQLKKGGGRSYKKMLSKVIPLGGGKIAEGNCQEGELETWPQV